jgi:hypothetical protein
MRWAASILELEQGLSYKVSANLLLHCCMG